MTITSQLETITPQIAATYLALSQGNRVLRRTRLESYAEQMKKGEWRVTGEPIIFSHTSLINGHHRLQACIASGSEFQSMVVRGVDASAYDVIDSGLMRSVADALGPDVRNQKLCAAVARLYLAYEANITDNPRTIHVKVTRQMLIDHVRQNEDLYAWATESHAAVQRSPLTSTAFAVFRMIVGQQHELLEEFCTGVRTGANLEMGDPRLALRNWAARTDSRSSEVHLSAMIRAWNAYRKHASLSRIMPWFRGQLFPRVEEGNQ